MAWVFQRICLFRSMMVVSGERRGVEGKVERKCVEGKVERKCESVGECDILNGCVQERSGLGL